MLEYRIVGGTGEHRSWLVATRRSSWSPKYISAFLEHGHKPRMGKSMPVPTGMETEMKTCLWRSMSSTGGRVRQRTLQRGNRGSYWFFHSLPGRYPPKCGVLPWPWFNSLSPTSDQDRGQPGGVCKGWTVRQVLDTCSPDLQTAAHTWQLKSAGMVCHCSGPKFEAKSADFWKQKQNVFFSFTFDVW